MNDPGTPPFRRILLKLSGEALMGGLPHGFDPNVLESVAGEIVAVVKRGVQVGVVIGAGNIFRGVQSASFGIGRVPADAMGMLGTVINAVAMAEIVQQMGVPTHVMTAVPMAPFGEPFIAHRAVALLGEGHVVFFGGGTGNPFFTTDSAAALRALEIAADVLMKATKVDGVYDADPVRHPSATLFPRLTYADVLRRQLRVMDLTAVSLAMENGLPLIVFNMTHPGNLLRAVSGERVGTFIRGEDV